MDDTLNCYKILDVEPGASAERVRRAYIALAQTWDPDKYVANPTLHAHMEKKRKEIDEAYNALRAFLPGLQGLPEEREKSQEPERDFTEMARETPIEWSRAVLGILVGLVFLFMFAWAFYLLTKGRIATPAPPTLE